jgi:hypothetical protein
MTTNHGKRYASWKKGECDPAEVAVNGVFPEAGTSLQELPVALRTSRNDP